MENVRKLLDDCKKHAGIKSDYALAKLLDLPNQRIYDYYKGNRAPDEFACLQISRILGKSFEEITTLVKVNTEKDEKRREVWRNHMKSLQRLAACLFMMIGLTCHFQNDTHAGSLETTRPASDDVQIIQIMRTRIAEFYHQAFRLRFRA